MKILYFVEQFIAKSETFILNQVNWFNTTDDIKILCNLTKNDSLKGELDVVEIPFSKSLVNRLSDRATYISRSNKTFAKSVHTFIDTFKPDVIHCHFGIQALTLLDNLSRTDIPIIITFHGYDATSYIKTSLMYRKRLKSLFENTYIFPLFVCAYHRNLLADYDIASKNSILLYNGVYLDVFEMGQDLVKEESKTFIQVSRFVEKKGHSYTIDAFHQYFKKFPSSEVQVKFIGDGHLKEDLIQKVNSLGLEKRIFFLPWMTHKQIVEELNKASYYVQHSVTATNGDEEATSISIMEAMAMNLPVLSSIHAGIPEVVEHGVDGILVKERDISTFAKSIEEIMSMEKNESRREKIASNFNLRKRNVSLREIYLKIQSIF